MEMTRDEILVGLLDGTVPFEAYSAKETIGLFGEAHVFITNDGEKSLTEAFREAKRMAGWDC